MQKKKQHIAQHLVGYKPKKDLLMIKKLFGCRHYLVAITHFNLNAIY